MLWRYRREISFTLVLLVFCGQCAVVSAQSSCCFDYCNTTLRESVCEGNVPFGACPERTRSDVCACSWRAADARCVPALEEEDGGGPNIGKIAYIVAGVVAALLIIVVGGFYWLHRETAFKTRQGDMAKRIIGFRKGKQQQSVRRISMETVSTHPTLTNYSPRSMSLASHAPSNEGTLRGGGDASGVGHFLGEVGTPANSRPTSHRSNRVKRRGMQSKESSQHSTTQSNGGGEGGGGGGKGGDMSRTSSAPESGSKASEHTPAAGMARLTAQPAARAPAHRPAPSPVSKVLPAGATASSPGTGFVFAPPPAPTRQSLPPAPTVTPPQSLPPAPTPAILPANPPLQSFGRPPLAPVPNAHEIHLGLGYTIRARLPSTESNAPSVEEPRGRFYSNASLPSVASNSPGASRAASPDPFQPAFVSAVQGVRVI